MVAYSFKPRFREPILAGTKTQTIRSFAKRRHAQPDDVLHLYTGLRTRQARIIIRTICIRHTGVTIHMPRKDYWWVIVGGVKLREKTSLDDFAGADGFLNFADLQKFWIENHPEDYANGIFEGVLIGWRPPSEPRA